MIDCIRIQPGTLKGSIDLSYSSPSKSLLIRAILFGALAGHDSKNVFNALCYSRNLTSEIACMAQHGYENHTEYCRAHELSVTVGCIYARDNAFERLSYPNDIASSLNYTHADDFLSERPYYCTQNTQSLVCPYARDDIFAMLCYSEDVAAAIKCARAIIDHRNEYNVGESATVLRFMIPIALVLHGGGKFNLGNTLVRRTLEPYEVSLPNVEFIRDGSTLTVKGKIDPGEIVIPGDISSQFISGLLAALPLLNGDSVIHTSTPLQSKQYAIMTTEMLKRFGIEIETDTGSDVFRVRGNQNYKEYTEMDWLEGDWSFAANLIAANSMGAKIEIIGLNNPSLQGDTAILELIHSRNIDMGANPDLFPILSVLACSREGETIFTNCSRLRLKESDRLHAMSVELLRLGAKVEEGATGMRVMGTGRLCGGVADAHNDHRVAMALTMASLICDKPITLSGALNAVKKSAGNFYSIFSALQGHCEVAER